MLYTLGHSPWQCDFTGLLALLTPEDDLLLLQDGVIAALDGGAFCEALRAGAAAVSVLSEDVRARGLEGRLCPAFAVLDYAGFVRLSVKQPCQLCW